MADVINRTTLEFLGSVNTPDYPVASWIHNPNLSAVASVPKQYWKISGDSVLEMTLSEKNTADSNALASQLAADRTFQKNRIDAERLIQAVVLEAIREFAKCTVLPNQSLRTAAQWKSDIKARIDVL